MYTHKYKHTHTHTDIPSDTSPPSPSTQDSEEMSKEWWEQRLTHKPWK